MFLLFGSEIFISAMVSISFFFTQWSCNVCLPTNTVVSLSINRVNFSRTTNLTFTSVIRDGLICIIIESDYEDVI